MTELEQRLERIRKRRFAPGEEDWWDKLIADLLASRARTLSDLHDCLDNHPSADVRAKACWLLGFVGDRRSSVPRLVRALGDAEVRGAAMNALESLGGRRMRQLLVPLLSNPDAEVRLAAAIALKAGDPDPSAVDALLEALGDPDARVRDNAAESVGVLNPRRGRKSVREALEVALGDESPEVRYSAAFSLAWMGDAKTLPALDRLAASDHAHAFLETVGAEAARAAESIRIRLRRGDGRLAELP